MASSNTLVVAIDFGTTYSGYAYSFKSDTTNVKTVNKWSSKLDSQKTPTSVLLTPARKLHSFGYDAEEHYAELLEDDEAENWALFRRIKMVLYGKKELSEQTEIWDVTDTVNMPAMDIFSIAIKFLKDHAIEAVKDPRNTGKEGKNLAESDIYFILTVPAIWDDSARLFMRKAAVRAGIPEAKLGLALESEAASIWCQSIPLVVSKGQNNDLSAIGARYMVVDIGGGTADITVPEKQSDGSLRELCWASGGDWGGTKVDEEFLRMLEGLMGKEAVERFKRECMADLFDLLRQFEMVKRTTDPKLDGKLKVRLPESLRDISRNANRSAFMNSLLKSIQALQNEGLSIKKDKLRIDANKAREMFAYSVDGMCTKMRNILSNPKAAGVRHILVVGGFSDSPVVREALKKKFRDVSLIFPPEPSLAVLKGAVLYGHKPQIIASRIAKFTYGLKHEEDFDESKHKKKYRRSINGKPMCEKLFQILVKKGDTVINGQKVAIQNQPTPDDHNVMTYEMYLCTKPHPMYVDEPECKKHGAVRTRLIPGDREVEAVLIIKDTDMFIELKHVKSRKSQTERFDFM